MNTYLVLSILISFIVTFFTSFYFYRTLEEELAETSEARLTEEVSILIAFSVFLIVAMISTIFASSRILRKGVSEDVRKEVISRHIKYIAILILTFILYSQKIVEEVVFNKQEPQWLDSISVYLFAS